MYILFYFLPFLFPLVTNSWPKIVDKNAPFSTDQAPIVPTNEIHSRQKRIVEIVLGGLFAGALVKRHYKRKMKKYKRKLRMAKYGQMDPYPPYGQYPRPSYPYHHRSNHPNGKYRRRYPSDYLPSEFGQKQRMDRQMEMMRRNGQQSKSSKEKMANLNGVYPNSSPQINSPPSNTMPDSNVPAPNLVNSATQNTMPNAVPDPPPTSSKGYFGSALGAIGQTASAAAAFSQPFVKNVAPTVIKTGLTTAGSALGLAALGPVGAAGAGYAINSASNYLSNSLFPQNSASPSPNPINSPSNPTTNP